MSKINFLKTIYDLDITAFDNLMTQKKSIKKKIKPAKPDT